MKQTNLFEPLVELDKFHPNLSKILPQPEGDWHGPTRIALQESFDKLPKPDRNFIKDFQTTGFDGRVWELYLNEMFRAVGLSVEQPYDRPDFLLSNARGEAVWVEAVTANASQVFEEKSEAEEGLWSGQDEVAIKLGAPLTDKLKKKYWERHWVTGKPLVLAIADFHDSSPGLRNSVHGLERYAYGLHARLTSSVGQEVRYVEEELAKHVGRKTIPSGFFKLEGAENVSALLFSNAGTIAKFSRMGFLKHPVPGMIIARFGTEYDDNPKAIMPAAFSYFVDEEAEDWNDEAVVLHNPYAKYPLPDAFFGRTSYTIYENGRTAFFTHGNFIYSSVTEKRLCPEKDKTFHKTVFALDLEHWLQNYDKARHEMEQQVVTAHREQKQKEQ
jgi:hypothetical protein